MLLLLLHNKTAAAPSSTNSGAELIEECPLNFKVYDCIIVYTFSFAMVFSFSGVTLLTSLFCASSTISIRSNSFSFHIPSISIKYKQSVYFSSCNCFHLLSLQLKAILETVFSKHGRTCLFILFAYLLNMNLQISF